MERKIKFSVLMSIYAKESPRNLEEAIKSILNQTLLPDEFVVIEDGKLTEELEKVIQFYEQKEKIVVYRYAENRGLGLALKGGVTLCNNPYIARMDSDDVAVPDRFEKQISFLEEHPYIAILGGYIEEYNQEMTKKLAVRKVALYNKEIRRKMKNRSQFNHSTVIFKKEKILQAGNYRDCYLMEDYDLWIRLMDTDCQMANLEEILVQNRTDKEMYQRRSGKKYIQSIVAIEKLLKQKKYSNSFQYFFNSCIRTLVAIMPLGLRKVIYEKILR